MKKWFLRLSLVLLLALALCGAARAEEVSYLSPAPGTCWAVTNEGDNDVSVSLNNLDYVVTDPEGYVTARDVTAAYPSNNPVIPAGGTALLQNSGAFSGVVTLNGTFSAQQLDSPAFLHEELFYGETCRFANKTDHVADVLVRGEPSACVIYDSDGAVTETILPGGSVGRNEFLLSVPAGGRAEVTPNGYVLYRENLSSKAWSALVLCMARTENFTAERTATSPWTFGAVPYNQPVSFRNVTEEDQTIQTGSCPYALYDRNENLVSVTTGSAISVPAGYTVALGSSDLNGARYAFLTDAFAPADLPGPVTQYENRNLKVTFRNTSGKAAPVYGITESKVNAKPDLYDLTGLVSPTEDGKGILLPNGATLTVTGDHGDDLFTLEGQFTVSAVGLPEAGKETAVLTEGEACVLTNPGGEAVSVMLCGQSVSVYGDGRDILSSYYQGYNWGRTSSEIGLSAGGSLTVQAVQGCCALQFDAGAVTVRGDAEPIYTTFFLQPGQGLLTNKWLSGYGNPYVMQALEKADADAAETPCAIQALGTAIFQVRPGDAERTDTPLVQSLTLKKGETCRMTNTTSLSSVQLSVRGAALMAYCGEDGLWDHSYTTAPLANKNMHLDSSARTVSFTALEDGFTVRYCPALTEVRTGAEALYDTVTVPKGESRTFRAAAANPLIFAWGFNTERSFFQSSQNQWGEAQRGLYNITVNTSTSWPVIKITATDSDATVIYLRDHIETGPVLAIDRTLRRGGETVSPDQVGSAPVDTVDLTLLPERKEAFTLILAAYDRAGKLIKAVSHPVAEGEVTPDRAMTLSIPFACGTDAATIRLMTVDGQFRPLTDAVTLAGE